MDQKRRLFIYDRREVGILILLGVGVALFAFTLGVHLGKQVVPKAIETAGEPKTSESLTAGESQAPSRVEISGEVKNVPAAADETLDQSLRDEIAKTGMKVDKTRQVDLPSEVHKVVNQPEVGRPESTAETKPKAKAATSPKTESATEAASSNAVLRYTLQVGSYPSLREAEPELLKLNENGLRAEVREVELAGKGKWFRLFVGQFESVRDAEKAGKSFKKERRIAEFVIVRAPTASTSRE